MTKPIEPTGWRARIGVLIPQLDYLTEPLLPRYLPDGVSFHVSRMRRTGPVTAESLAGMNTAINDAADLLPLPFLDLVLYHCTMGSLLYEPERLARDLEQRTRLPVIATAQAVIAALRALGARRVSLVTPYSVALNDAEAAFLRRQGLELTGVGGANIDDSGGMQSVAPEEICAWVRRTPHAGSDAIFISCTGIRSHPFIEALEQDVGVPVITSLSAVIWRVHAQLGVQPGALGLGRLLRLAAQRSAAAP